MRLIIEGKEYQNFTQIFINDEYDSFGAIFNISGPPDVMPKELLYKKCKIYEGEILILSGYLIGYYISIGNDEESVTIAGYSLPAVLEDVNLPNEMYPPKMNLMSLTQIVKKLLNFFDIEYVIHNNVLDDMNKVIQKTGISPKQSIKSFIAALASQANIFITHDESGRLHFLRPEKQDAVRLHINDKVITNFDYRINGQQLHNPITIRRQVGRMEWGQKIINNPFCPANRPYTRITHNGAFVDLETAAKNYLAQEMSTIKLYIKTNKYFKPGTIIALTVPQLEFEDREFFVDNIRLTQTRDMKEYSMSLVFKEVYYDKKS